ncbi:MAG: hypothetical protein GKS00_22000 [Alphaproteobacteria bacterium]|nr:hypothetical protein [Alphaproteobacteria bacterium]
MGSLFGGSAPPPPPPVPERDDPAVKDAERRERLAAARRRGRRATILTSGQGAEGEALTGRPSPTGGGQLQQPRTLLGQ